MKSKKTKLKRTTFLHIIPPSLTNFIITARTLATILTVTVDIGMWNEWPVKLFVPCIVWFAITLCCLVSPVSSSEWQWKCVIMSLGQLLENHSSSATPVLASLLWWPHYHHWCRGARHLTVYILSILPNIGTGCVDNYLGTEAFLLLGISAGTYVWLWVKMGQKS